MAIVPKKWEGMWLFMAMHYFIMGAYPEMRDEMTLLLCNPHVKYTKLATVPARDTKVAPS